jgi:hypothetical protein
VECGANGNRVAASRSYSPTLEEKDSLLAWHVTLLEPNSQIVRTDFNTEILSLEAPSGDEGRRVVVAGRQQKMHRCIREPTFLRADKCDTHRILDRFTHHPRMTYLSW